MGVEVYHYQDKTIGKNVNEKGSLQNLVNEEFKKIEKQHGVGFRDDQEIRNAGWNTIAKMIDEIKKDKSMVYGPWGLGPLVDLSNKLKKEYNDMKGCKLFTNNADKIYQVAQSIDNAEKEALKRLKRNSTVQDTRNLAAKVEKDKTGTPMFITEKSKDGKDTGNLVFTKAANPVRIDQALKGLFTNPDIVYIIDYSKCDTSTPKGKAIKDKMTQLIGDQKCYLRYDKDQKTYTIRDTLGEGLSDRAYIREGVRLIPDGVRQRDAYIEEKRGNNQIGKFDDKWVESQVNLFLKDVPSAKKLTDEQKKRLISKTESRVNELLRKAKSLGYELETEPVTKKWFGKGHMELHLISGTSEVDRPFWENVGQIGSDLSEFIDKNEGEYAKYLTKRVQNRWNQMDKLTKTESVDVKSDVKDEKDKIADKNSIIYGLSMFEEMIDNFRGSEGDSWMDKDDRRLVRIKKILRDGKKSLNDADDIGKKAIEKNIIIPLRIEWSTFKRIPPHITDKDGNTIDNPNWKAQKQYLNNVFFGSTEQQLKAIREMGSLNRIWDKTETSFVAEEIENGIETEIENDDGSKSRGLETNDESINKYLDNIEKRCALTNSNDEKHDEIINNVQKEFIDSIYVSARGNLDNFIQFFVDKGMFPAVWKTHTKDVQKLTKEKFGQLKNSFQENEKQIDKLSINDEAKRQHEERLILEQKENKTEEDLMKLQSLIFLEENPSAQAELNQKTLDTMKLEFKYGNVSKMVKGTLFSVFAEMGGGARGKNADIYNDIRGYGFRNLSDENAKIAGEIAAEIAITVAVAVVTAGAGAAVMQGIMRGASVLAKGVKMYGLANKIEKIVRIVRLGRKGFKVANLAGKAAYLAINAGGLLIEGTIFNAASNMIHSAVNGTSLDTLNLNPVAKENIQTAAFLGALSISGKITQGLMNVGGKTKLAINLSEGLEKAHLMSPAKFTTGLVSEMGSMLAAEQAVNFLFGHDIINPETGEVEKSRKPTVPTQEELIQMVGMILAFRMVKPGLWQRYAKKLSDGTLEICRSVKKNEVLIRDPKTGKVEKIQDLIDGHYNNYKPTPEQYQLRNHNQRLEKQSKYNTEYSQARDEIIRLPENLRSQAMKKFIETGDMIEQSPNDIKRIQREIGLTGKDVDGVVGPQTLEKLKKYVSKGGESKEVVNDKTVEKARESLYDKFDAGIMSKNGLTMDGITYKLERKPYEGQNQSHKGRIIYTETGPDGQIKFKVEANSNTFSLPENSNGNRIRDRFNSARKKYIDQNLDATIRSNRQEVIEGLSRKIESKTGDLEQKRQDKVTLEGKKKTLSNEIDGLKSRKARLEGQLKSIPREITIQPENVSLNDIYKVFFEGAGKTVSIGGKKCNFIKVEGNKIIFDKCEFGSFKDLKDAGIKFDIDIKKKQQRNRTDKTYERQQKLFDELVEAEAKMSKSNEIITKYENLQQKKAQVESEIKTNKFFADKAQELASKHVHIWIDGVEYQCTGKNTNNGKTTLDFKKTDGSDHFTISSFEQLKSKGKQIKGFEVLKTNQPRFETENDALLQGLLNGEPEYINKKKQELQQIDQQLQSGKSEYDNAKLATSPKKVPNPEYERVQNEIEGIKNQLIGKEADLNALNQKLGTAANEISALETEISGLKAEKDRLTNNQEAERQRQAEAERQRQAEQERQRQAEAERQRQAEAERQRQAEQERQRQAEQERQRQAEAERQRQAEQERQRQAEAERQRQAEQERQRQAEAERQRQAEADARAREEAEAKRKAAEEAARQKKAAEDAKENRKREIKHTYKELMQEFHPDKNGIGVLFKDIVGRDMNNGEKTRFQNDSENMKNNFERISQKLNELKENNDLNGLKNIYDKRIEIKEKIQQKIKEQFEDIKRAEDARRAEEARRAEAARRMNANQDRQKKNINSYTKNLKTEDGGIFSGEIRNGEIYEGIFVDKDGGRRYINKASEYPVMKYQDKILLDKILSKESVNVGELKWTHRTNFETLQQIINSGVIGNNGSRGVQFWGGLGACYGDVVLIMKDSVMNLPAAPENLNKGDGNYNYFFSGAGAKDRTWSQFQQEASDFSFRRQGRGENPNIDVPYLSIGGKNGTHGNFNHEVGVDHIEAVMIPAHAKNNPGYKELVRKLNAKGIKVIEVQTENNILDYAGGSILFANDGRRGSFDVAIKAELSRRYPNLKTFQEQAIEYLRDTGRINYIEGKSFDDYRQDYLNVSVENGLSRGATRGGQYQNYSSQKNYTREQQAYFRYIIESRIAKERGSYPHPTVGSNRFSKAA